MTLSGSVRIHGESGTAEQRPAFSVFIFPVREVLNFTGPCQSSDRGGRTESLLIHLESIPMLWKKSDNASR